MTCPEYEEGYDPFLNKTFGRYCTNCGVLHSLHDGMDK